MRSHYPSCMRMAGLILVFGALLAACGSAVGSGGQPEANPSAPEDPSIPTELPAAQTPPIPPADGELEQTIDPELINRRVEDFEAYVPPRLIGPDGIRPIYDPQFATAADAPLEDEELVIGVALEAEAKAYPITVLRFREMVNDELGELPILVTW